MKEDPYFFAGLILTLKFPLELDYSVRFFVGEVCLARRAWSDSSTSAPDHLVPCQMG